MSLSAQLKQPLKKFRWRARRRAAARRYGGDALANTPIVIGNAMPKSGSHLLHQVLLGLTALGPFIDPGMPPLTRSADNHNLSESQVLARIAELVAGDIAYAYLQARPAYIDALRQTGLAALFIHRDPRDMLVSHVFYATDLHPGHGMHAYYQALDSMEARLNAAIEGVDEGQFQLSPIRAKYEKYLPWLSVPEVQALRFEDFIQRREIALGQILDHLEARGFNPIRPRDEALAHLSAAIQPRKSGTFRKGQVGDWREHFTAANKANFKARCGDLLQQLGYEGDAAW